MFDKIILKVLLCFVEFFSNLTQAQLQLSKCPLSSSPSKIQDRPQHLHQVKKQLQEYVCARCRVLKKNIYIFITTSQPVLLSLSFTHSMFDYMSFFFYLDMYILNFFVVFMYLNEIERDV